MNKALLMVIMFFVMIVGNETMGQQIVVSNTQYVAQPVLSYVPVQTFVYQPVVTYTIYQAPAIYYPGCFCWHNRYNNMYYPYVTYNYPIYLNIR
jgi:hypothetical protein